MSIDERARQLGLILPEAFKSPSGAVYPFSWVRVRGSRAYVSGHLPLNPDGSLAEPKGKVGGELSEHALVWFERAAIAGAVVDVLALGWEWTKLGLESKIRAEREGSGGPTCREYVISAFRLPC